MSYTHTIRQIYTAGTVQAADKTYTYTSGAEVNFDEACADSSTTILAAVIDKTKIISFEMLSDQAVTVNTNSPTDNTFVLAANIPYMWSADLGANPVTVNIASLRVVNASGFSARFRARFLVDPT